MSTTIKNRPVVGQVVRWIEPGEYPRNPEYITKKKADYPGELRIHSIENQPSRGKGFFFVTVSHNGSPIMSAVDTGRPAIFDPSWFHWDGE